ncbi:hypothetical protein MPC1_13380001 [Methylocella tundrae]|nr:hypothetical protein MPC1_13380001 [Methylocella tundrae]
MFSDTQRSSHAKEAVALFMARYGV